MTNALTVFLLAHCALYGADPDAQANRLSMRFYLSSPVDGAQPLPFRHASITVRNTGDAPIKLWEPDSRQGWGMLTLRYTNARGQMFLAWRADPRWWEVNDPTETTFVVPAHGERFIAIVLFGYIGPRGNLPLWYGLPEPNTDEEYTLVAIVDIPASEEAKGKGVWTGRIVSEPAKGKIIDNDIKSPDDYLRAGYPKRALAMMQENPGWVTRDDAVPLQLAARYSSEGTEDVIAWLLGAGVDINARAHENTSPLYCAKDARMVAFLLRYRPDLRPVHRVGNKVASPLEEMAYRMIHPYEDKEDARRCFRLLLDAGAEYDVRSAIRLNDFDRVQEIAKTQPRAIKQALGALRLAATQDHARICKLLLELGADPEDLEGGSGISILASACKHSEVVKVLLEGGAKANARVQHIGGGSGIAVVEGSATPLHYAAEAGNVESARLLLERGADLEAQDGDGHSPLHIAAIMSHPKMVEFLIARGAKIDAKNKNGTTLLGLAEGSTMGAYARPEGAAEKKRTIELLQKVLAK